MDSSPAIGSDGTIYIGSNYIYALNPDGTLKWENRINEQYADIGWASPTVGVNGVVYIS